jgi:hypothetical protein
MASEKLKIKDKGHVGIFHLDWKKRVSKSAASQTDLKGQKTISFGGGGDDHVSSAADDDDESNGEYNAVGT